MSDASVLGARLLVGGYVAAHGAQKLFGAFGGYGLEGTGGYFEMLGLKPGRSMAAAAGASELVGGLLTATGLGGVAGPAAVGSTMAVASMAAHRGKGAFAASGGPELPLTNLAAVALIGARGPGRYSLDSLFGVRMAPRATAIVLAGSAALAAVLSAQAVRGAPTPEESPDAQETELEAAGEPAASGAGAS